MESFYQFILSKIKTLSIILTMLYLRARSCPKTYSTKTMLPFIIYYCSWTTWYFLCSFL